MLLNTHIINMETDIEFWNKQIKDQYTYLDKLKAEYELHKMNQERFTLLWSSACDQLSYFIQKADQLENISPM